MKPLAVLAVALIVAGIGVLAFQGFTYTSREKVLDIGPLHASVEREREFPVAPIAGVAAVAGGIVLLIVSKKK